MRLSLISFLSFFTITISLGKDVVGDETLDSSIENEKESNLSKERSPARTNSRNSYFQSFKIDSSKNGYGGFYEGTSPLAYSYDENNDGEFAGWVAVYRQLRGLDGPSGFLGIAQSDPSGENWTITDKVNTSYPEGQTYTASDPGLPTPGGSPAARYPSAVVSSYHNKPTAIWNEYTLGDATTSSTGGIIPGYGGGETGGVPMWTYDSFVTGDGAYFSANLHLNEGCLQVNFNNGGVCDPPDLWQGNVQLIDGSDGAVRLLAMYTSWADVENYSRYMIRSLNITNGYISVEEPNYFQSDTLDEDGLGNCLWYDCGTGYTGIPDFHVGTSGRGYMALSSNTFDSDNEPPYLHTIFFRYTDNYGETWSGVDDGGYKNSGYYYLPDAELMEIHDSLLTMWSLDPDTYSDKPWYPWAVDSEGSIVGDTINYFNDTTETGVPYDYFYTSAYFIHYEYDIITDQDGGMHFAAMSWPYLCKDDNGGCDDGDGDGIPDSLYLENRFAGAGMYHYYNPDPISQPNNWRVSFIEDYSEIFNMDFPVDGPMSLYTDAPFYFVPNIRPSYEDGSQVLWYASTSVSRASYNDDSTLYIPSDLDLYMAKSVDNGKTWTVPENVTNTPSTVSDPQIEYGYHLANVGSDYEIGIFYQMPNLDPDFKTVTDNGTDDWMDYVNYVYVGKYENDLEFLSVTKGNDEEITPSNFVLKQNYPNPFNPITKISYGIDKASDVKLSLYDVRGGFVENLINKRVGAGNYDFMLDASHLSSGVYFYTMTVDNVSQTRKLILMK